MRDTLRTTRISVGRNIRRLRLLRGFSQERLAELSGTGSKFIGQIERGEVNVSIDRLSSIARALSVSVSALFDGPRPAAPANAKVFLLSERELDQIEQALQTVHAVRRAAQPPRRR